MPTRRQFIRAIPAAAGLSLATGVAAGQRNYEVPENVTISFDQTLLEQHKPRLVTHHLDIKPNAWYGWTARSPDYDTDAHCYICRYPGQSGFIPAGSLLSDSHRFDHEPVLVFTDAETGKLQSITPSIYHWLAESFPRESLTLVDERPSLVAAKPWHHYQPDATKTGEDDIDLRNLDGELDSWLANGFEIYLPALTEPWVMEGPTGREHFWRSWEAGFGISPPAILWSGLQQAGLFTGSYAEV